MKVEGTFLRSRIARRTFLYFCAAALGPVLVLSLMAYRALDDSSRQARDREVVAAAKAYAFQVLERLDSASSVLEFLAANPSADGARSYGDPPPMFRQVRALPGPADVTRLQAGTRVVVRPVEGDLPAVTLVHVAVPAPDSAAPATAWMGELDRAFLWGPDEELEDGQSVCVRVQDGPMLHCGGGASAVDAGSEVPSGEWTLFLGGRFDTPSWVFTTSLPARGALEALPALLRKIGWIWLGTLLLVALLSLLVIRRTMLPLEELIEQTRRIPLGLKREHRARRNDEFGRLTTAFDEMGETVARQLGALRALSAVDEKILQGRPLGEVVHLVLDRIRHLFPDALVGVAILPSPEKKGGMYWRAAGDGTIRRSRLSDAGQVGTDDPPAEHWWPAHRFASGRGIAPTLASEGAARLWYTPLRTVEGVAGQLAVGIVDEVTPPDAEMHELSEMARRLAVAMASQEREARLISQARRDALTGLPNRFAAQEALADIVAAAERSGHSVAVLFLDLDGFKAINDGLGHATGDRVLVQAAGLLDSLAPGGSQFVARYGGDEFLVILARSDVTSAIRAAEEAVSRLTRPVVVDGVELFLGVSIGIAMYPEHATGVERLIRHSDIAMYVSKKSGGNGVRMFEPWMTGDATDRVQLEADLHRAVAAGEVAVHFQPVVDTRSGRVVGAEALARWNHPARGRIAPDVFIPLAESSGLIEELGDHVLEVACRAFASWKRTGFELGSVAVNVSGRQLQSARFVETVQRAMARHGMGRGELEIEVTESMLMVDVARAAERLAAIRALGVHISVDDFGTGYSSLAYLKDLPVDILKIDRAFISEMNTSPGGFALVRAIIAMAHATGKSLIAEGVEDTAQVEALRDMGCARIQGYWFSPPVAEGAMPSLLSSTLATGPQS